MDNRTISDRLRDAGYGNRPRSNENLYGREVYSLETGELIGCMDAFEALEFLAKIERKKAA